MSHKLVFGRVTRTTPRAVLLAVEEKGELREHWVPRSQIEDGEEVEEGADELYISIWFCEKMDV